MRSRIYSLSHKQTLKTSTLNQGIAPWQIRRQKYREKLAKSVTCKVYLVHWIFKMTMCFLLGTKSLNCLQNSRRSWLANWNKSNSHLYRSSLLWTRTLTNQICSSQMKNKKMRNSIRLSLWLTISGYRDKRRQAKK